MEKQQLRSIHTGTNDRQLTPPKRLFAQSFRNHAKRQRNSVASLSPAARSRKHALASAGPKALARRLARKPHPERPRARARCCSPSTSRILSTPACSRERALASAGSTTLVRFAARKFYPEQPRARARCHSSRTNYTPARDTHTRSDIQRVTFQPAAISAQNRARPLEGECNGIHGRDVIVHRTNALAGLCLI